jgi:hypothetical protein
MRAAILASLLALLSTTAFAQAPAPENPTVMVGPWTIATTFRADKFDSCSMSRTTSDLDVSFVRGSDGLLLELDSPKWKLERGKAYTVRLTAGSRSIDAKALAETKTVTIALADPPLNEKLRAVNVLDVKGEGATLAVPLDGSAAALARLETCFDKNSQTGVEANPFVAPSRKP